MIRKGGYMGKILNVDLTEQRAYTEPLPEEYIRSFLGGAGINAKLVYDRVAPGIDPLAPENVLAFGAGPLVGTLVPGSGKCNVTGKSPHLGVLAGSGHGLLGMLKFTGHDHLVITGKAERPIYLKITDGQVEFCEATHLWGKDLWQTTDAIWRECGEQYVVSAIGPAGENCLKDACIATNKYATMARSGMGGIMGSKNLKAIAMYGTNSVEVADPQTFVKLVDELYEQISSFPSFSDWRKYGTLISYETFAKEGVFAARNFQLGYGEELLQDLKLEDFLEVKQGDVACQACPVGCKHYIEVPGEDLRVSISCVNSAIQGFGAMIDVRGWKPVIRLAALSARLGLDFWGVGGLVSLAMELYQRGIIDKSTTGGLELVWGNSEAAAELIEQIAYKKGFGALLSEGPERASELLGEQVSFYPMHAKGHALLFDPRVRSGSTEFFSQFTNVRGQVSHISVLTVSRTAEQIRRFAERKGIPQERLPEVLDGPDGYNKGRFSKWCEDITTVMECLGVCMFPLFQRINFDNWAQLYQAVTGIEASSSKLLRTATNLWDCRRAFNLREGLTAESDMPPQRFLLESVVVDGKEYQRLDAEKFQESLRDYYDERGWDPVGGIPDKSKLEELGLA